MTLGVMVKVMVFSATFNKISIIWRGSVVLVEKTGVPTCRKSLTILESWRWIKTSLQFIAVCTMSRFTIHYLFSYIKKSTPWYREYFTDISNAVKPVYNGSFCVFIELRWEVIVRFVDSGGFVDHRSLNFPFISNDRFVCTII